MGQAAVVAGDKITGNCSTHLIPNPSGSPTPAPPMPFSAPLSTELATTVVIGGLPAAVVGSGGLSTPPHPGLHPSDPFFAPPTQRGQVMQGSSTVFFDGKPAAYTGCPVGICANLPGQISGTATTVQVGA